MVSISNRARKKSFGFTLEPETSFHSCNGTSMIVCSNFSPSLISRAKSSTSKVHLTEKGLAKAQSREGSWPRDSRDGTCSLFLLPHDCRHEKTFSKSEDLFPLTFNVIWDKHIGFMKCKEELLDVKELMLQLM